MDTYLFVKKLNEDQSIVLDQTKLLLCRRKQVQFYNAQIYQYLKDHLHPNINPIIDIEHNGNSLIITEPEIQGKALSEILDNLSLKDREHIFDQVLDGVEFLHNADPPIIHRDLKAENIMITEDGNVKIIDFDAAKITGGKKSRDTVLLGTEGTAAPEQYGFGESDVRTDIYGLGRLAELLFPDRHEFAACATAIDPEDRFQNICEMRKAFHSSLKPYSWKPFTTAQPRTALRFCLYQLIVLFFSYCIGLQNISTNLFMFLVMELSYMLFAKWTPLFSIFKEIRNKSFPIRILSYFVAFLFVLFLSSLFVNLFF